MQRRCTKAFSPVLHQDRTSSTKRLVRQRWDDIGINQALAMSADKHRIVEQITTDTYHSLHCGEVYNEGRALQNNVTIKANGSKIQLLIANYREARLRFSQTTLMINMYCSKNKLLAVRRSAVISCKKRMIRRVVPVTKCPQGSLDKKSNWAQACFGWVTQ
jgi:hypothetical protein